MFGLVIPQAQLDRVTRMGPPDEGVALRLRIDTALQYQAAPGIFRQLRRVFRLRRAQVAFGVHVQFYGVEYAVRK